MKYVRMATGLRVLRGRQPQTTERASCLREQVAVLQWRCSRSRTPSGSCPRPAMAVAAARTDTGRVSDCCDRDAYDETFGDRFARRIARRYRKRGLDRTRRRVVSPDEVERADVVVLHRVVCCYPDYERLLSAAAAHARRLLVFSHPPRTPVTRLSFAFDNLMRRLRHNDFRAFVHPPEPMVAVVQSQGMSLRYRHRGLAWTVVGFERQVSPTAAA
jgi:hypothetical protein